MSYDLIDGSIGKLEKITEVAVMTDTQQREAARQFVNRWIGKGKEDEDGRSYWIDLLTNVLGMDNITERLNFEKR